MPEKSITHKAKLPNWITPTKFSSTVVFLQTPKIRTHKIEMILCVYPTMERGRMVCA